MQEILTPVQFESTLDTLNLINKLYLSNNVSFAVDTIQASENPVGVGRPNKGKCSKCSANGAVCCRPVLQEITAYEYVLLINNGATKCVEHTFAQKVYGVQVLGWHRESPPTWPYWSTPNDAVIKRISAQYCTWLPFVGFTMKFCSETSGDRWRMKVWGFY